MEEYLLVATILKPYGLKGQCRVFASTSFASKRFKKGNKLLLKRNDEFEELTISSAFKKEGNFYIVSFENIETIEEIEKLYQMQLFTKKDEKLLHKNEYFYSDLVGLKVFDEDENELGSVVSVEEFPAQITLKISKNAAESHFFVPFNDFFVKSVNIENKKIIIHLIEGLTL